MVDYQAWLVFVFAFALFVLFLIFIAAKAEDR